MLAASQLRVREEVDARASWGAALRTGAAGSQDESRWSAIRKQRPYRVGSGIANLRSIGNAAQPGVPSCGGQGCATKAFPGGAVLWFNGRLGNTFWL